ncbi:MAG: hypothetical protein JWM25_876, partial [Thermoleophilia bacterium]|nr:hypothetical protein [Thermoleophilia bacterium]
MITRIAASTHLSPSSAPAAPLGAPSAPSAPGGTGPTIGLRPDVVPGEHIVVFQDGVSRTEQAQLLRGLAP